MKRSTQVKKIKCHSCGCEFNYYDENLEGALLSHENDMKEDYCADCALDGFEYCNVCNEYVLASGHNHLYWNDDCSSYAGVGSELALNNPEHYKPSIFAILDLSAKEAYRWNHHATKMALNLEHSLREGLVTLWIYGSVLSQDRILFSLDNGKGHCSEYGYIFDSLFRKNDAGIYHDGVMWLHGLDRKTKEANLLTAEWVSEWLIKNARSKENK
jgi:hypothetical protein